MIINDIRLRGRAVAGSTPAGRKSPHNHAQTVRNLGRSLPERPRCPANPGGLLDSKSAVDVAASLADASKSFIGCTAASIDGNDAIRNAPRPP